jgi:hypothetical protein
MAAEDASQLLEIEGLREEAFTARTEAQFNRASDELLRRADEAASSPEDRLLRAIEWGAALRPGPVPGDARRL